MVTAPMLVDLVTRYVLGPDESLTWTREYPDESAVDLEVGDRSYSVRVWPDLLIARMPWVDAVVVVRRDDPDVDGPAPREVLLVCVDGSVVRLTNLEEVGLLGMRVFDESLDPISYPEILVELHWPVEGPKRLVTDPDEWREQLPPGADVAGVGWPTTWSEEDGTRWMAFFSSHENPTAYGDQPLVEVYHWTVRFEAGETASWANAWLPPEAKVIPPWHGE
jgi:hypothetical protein